MAKSRLYVGLDVGGTSMKAGVVEDSGRPLGKAVSLPTEAPKGQTHGLELEKVFVLLGKEKIMKRVDSVLLGAGPERSPSHE